MMTGFRPDPIGHAPGDRLRHHCRRELATQDDRDLGIVEPDGLGVDRQEPEKGAVTEIHDGFDAGGDEDRRRPERPLRGPAGTRPRGRRMSLPGRRAIDIGQPHHDEQRQYANRADEKIGQRIAGA